MEAPRDAIISKVREWVAHADDDLRVAQHTLTLPDKCPYRLVAYHAQQCAEKYLKGFLVLHGIDFPYTHNIARLLELCAEHSSWAAMHKDAEELSPFAITARYPGEDEAVSDTEARRAIEVAVRLRDEVRRALGEEGIELSRG